ncbi:hypothetical protein EVAR_50348_1 [Eumeta japonica]|uniref:Uncharacterized protein n=1 Tax=Eumeta variegata TaxID=151549 RepID=A0A4C1XM45_EUMVA|nr:hypothetical protein EVAR_50348_1 [Eumeta japonica]
MVLIPGDFLARLSRGKTVPQTRVINRSSWLRHRRAPISARGSTARADASGGRGRRRAGRGTQFGAYPFALMQTGWTYPSLRLDVSCFGKRASEISESRWSPSPTDSRNPRGVNLRCRPLEEDRIYNGDGSGWWMSRERSEPSELSLTGRNEPQKLLLQRRNTRLRDNETYPVVPLSDLEQTDRCSITCRLRRERDRDGDRSGQRLIRNVFHVDELGSRKQRFNEMVSLHSFMSTYLLKSDTIHEILSTALIADTPCECTQRAIIYFVA